MLIRKSLQIVYSQLCFYGIFCFVIKLDLKEVHLLGNIILDMLKL